MKNFIAIDIGATKIIFALVKEKKIIKTKKINTPKNKEGLIKVLIENINDLKGDLKIKGIGIAAAGILDKKREKILNSPNLNYLNNFPLAEVLRKKVQSKVIMENDANCFTLGEAILGAAKDRKRVFGITLGSGVGGGLVIDSKIYQGAFGGAGEIGHSSIKFDGIKCECGNFGCFEEYCGKRFFQRKKVSSKELAKRAEKNDKRAKEIFKEYGRHLGIGIANLVNILEPEIIVIGGGIAKAQKHFLGEAKKEAKKRIISPPARRNLQIKPAKLGERASLFGLVYLLK